MKQNNGILKKDLESIVKKSSDLDVILKFDKAFNETHTFSVSIDEIADSFIIKNCPLKKESVNTVVSMINNKEIMQPIVCRKVDGKYEIILGRKRYYAFKNLGKPSISIIVIEVNDEEAAFMQLFHILDQTHRNVIEIGAIYSYLVDEKKNSKTVLSEITHQSIGQISNLMRILSLPDEVIVQIADDVISYGHAKVLVNLPTEKIYSVVAKIIKNKLSVRECERIVRNLHSNNEISITEDEIKNKTSATSVRITRDSIRLSFKNKRRFAAFLDKIKNG